MRAAARPSSLILSIGAAATALVAASGAAFAAGFALHEESTQFLGSALAGDAAGGALSSMFWNPAAVGQFNGIWSESAYTVVLPHAEIDALPGSTFVPVLPSDSGDMGRDAFVGASYVSYQLSPSVVFGLSINAPFGLGNKTNLNWAGETFSRENLLVTYNFAPTIAYRVVPGLIVGTGLQVEYIRAKLQGAAPLGTFPNFPQATTEGDDVGVGFTLGALWEPTIGTSLGLGFRSSIDHTLDGSFSVAGIGGNAATASLKTPELVTLSLRQALAPQWTALATVEWTNWSRLNELDTVCKTAGPFCAAPGSTINTLALGWHDGWLFSGGMEYAYSRELTLRAGIAYELSPIQNPDERIAQLPDANRVMVGTGASYSLKWCGTWCDSSTFDLAYAHTFIEDASINRTEGPITLLANTQGSADVISIGFKTHWGSSGGSVKPIK